MQTDTNETDKRNATSHSTRNFEDGDIQAIAGDLTKFQVRILATIIGKDRYGLGIKRALEDYYGEEINHGRLYPNLNDLADLDLVEISQRDRRTNNYAITERGRHVLAYEMEWLEDQLNGGEK